MIEIYGVKIDKEFINSKFNKKIIKILEDIYTKKNKYNEGIQQSALGEILVRNYLSKRLEIDKKDIVFSRNEHGKPFISQVRNFHFNISHSNDWVICTFDTIPIGVDIEKIRPINQEGAKEFMTSSEYKEMFERGRDEGLSFFFETWTYKESYVKAIGKGLIIPFSSINITKTDKSCLRMIVGETEKYFLRQYLIDNSGEYKVAVCSTRKDFPNDIIKLDCNKIVEEFCMLF